MKQQTYSKYCELAHLIYSILNSILVKKLETYALRSVYIFTRLSIQNITDKIINLLKSHARPKRGFFIKL